MSYARAVLGLLILIAAVFFLLKVAIVGAVFGLFALIVLIVILREGL